MKIVVSATGKADDSQGGLTKCASACQVGAVLSLTGTTANGIHTPQYFRRAECEPPPYLESISPAYGDMGAQVPVTITGGNFFGNLSLSVSGNIGVQIESNNETEIHATFTIPLQGTAGIQTFYVQNEWGYSNQLDFQDGDPTPVIQSVSPDQWNAGGQNIPITITGTGFGTNPTLEVTGAYVEGSSISSVSDNGQQAIIDATVSISANAPPGSFATVQVKSNGYNSQGFIAVQQGDSSQSNQVQASIVPFPANPPAIMVGKDSGGGICSSGTNVAGQTVNVYAGQQISLTGCIPNNGVLVASEEWSPSSFPTNTAVAGFNVGPSPGFVETITQVSATNCAAAYYCDMTPLYWVAQGTVQVTFSYILVNGLAGNAWVKFNIMGPTGYTNQNGVSTKVGAVGDYYVQVCDPQGHCSNQDVFGLWGLPANNGKFTGIQFLATGQEPQAPNAGVYSWVQLVNSDKVQSLDNYGYGLCSGLPTQTSLDATYPVTVGVFKTNVPDDTVVDSPSTTLEPNQGEWARVFSATMYLMWTPSTDPNCHNGSACIIPVPLGSLSWNLNGCSVNTQITNYGNSSTTWGTICGYPGSKTETVQFTPSSNYPWWGNAVYPGPTSCP